MATSSCTTTTTTLLEDYSFSRTNSVMILPQDPPTPVMSNQSPRNVIDPMTMNGGANGISSMPSLPKLNGDDDLSATSKGRDRTSHLQSLTHMNGESPYATNWNSNQPTADNGFTTTSAATSVASPPREARFSSPTEEPIIVHRSTILSSPSSPSSFSQSPSDQYDGGIDSSLFPFSVYNNTGGGESSSIDRLMLSSSSTGHTITNSTPSTGVADFTNGNHHSVQNLNNWNMFFLLLCDFFKSQVPLKILHQSLRQILRNDIGDLPYLTTLFRSMSSSLALQLMLQGPVGVQTSSSSSLSSSSLSSRRIRRSRRNRILRQRTVQISGLPNQGQTCFLNSVLQSLASLPPFLVYLDAITQYQQDMRDAGLVPGSEGEGHTISTTAVPSSSFSEQLLGLLLAINNCDTDDAEYDDDEDGLVSNSDHDDSRYRRRPTVTTTTTTRRPRRRLDPKGLLRKVGETNRQFKSSSLEQQDAQEFLQALLGVVIADAQLDSSTMSSERFFAYNGSCDSVVGGRVDSAFDSNGDVLGSLMSASLGGDTDDGLMTSAMANGVDEMGFSSASNDQSILSINASGNGLVLDAGEDNVLSLSGMLLRIEEEQNMASAETNGNSVNVMAAIRPTVHSPRSNQKLMMEVRELDNPLQEEKKQEHTEYHPFPFPSASIPSPTKEHREVKRNDNPNSGQQSVPTLTSVMRCSLSSITPSPLSGWIGSTLRCSRCKHVRPIQNAPFLDIPLVPTSVPTYLANAYHSGPKIVAPNSSAVIPCTLDDCLADFTSVERVEDVECRSCTIHREVDSLEEEVMMLRGAVETTEKRRRQKKGLSGDAMNGLDDPCQALRQDLAKAEMRLLQFKTMDPDEDDLHGALGHGPASTAADEDERFLFGIDEGAKVKTERCEAKKCLLLTRTPSILCCHIQRRYYDPFKNRMEKCVQFVAFPQTLDLSPYCAYGPRASTPWAAGASSSGDFEDDCVMTSTNDKESTVGKMPYRLQSIIEHRGNAFGGHYVSYRRNDSGEWFRISDDTVTPVPWSDVRICQAYMLFYEAI